MRIKIGKKPIFLGKISVSLIAVFFLSTPFLVSAVTLNDILTQINSVQTLLNNLVVGSQKTHTQGNTITSNQTQIANQPDNYNCALLVGNNLQLNDVGEDVRTLQKILNISPDTEIINVGAGSPGNETTHFGPLTYNALIKFQNKYASDILTPAGLISGTGFGGALTRAKMSDICDAATAGMTAQDFSSAELNGFHPSFFKNLSSYRKSIPYGSTNSTSNTVSIPSPVVSTVPVISASSTLSSQINAQIPTLILSISPATITAGQSATITWSSTNATQCTASSGWSGNKSVSGGSQSVSPSTNTTYSLLCSGANGTINQNVSITVNQVPLLPTTPAVSSTVSNLQWGVYAGDDQNDLASFETLVGKQVNMLAIFEGWTDSFPSGYSSNVGSKGKTLVIFWEPDFGYDAIINGSKDDYIKQFASDAEAYNYPVILVPFEEMNLNEEAWGYGMNGNTASKFITAWKHIHDLFASATNVKFAVDYNQDSVPDVPGNKFGDYYPGDNYVDYVGVDGFNFGSPWQTFEQVFGSALSTLSSYNKPTYIFSIASAAGPEKAAWIADAIGVQINTYPKIAGWVWFNVNKEADWRVNSDPASLQAFKAVLP